MRFDEYRKHDATALAGLIAKREVSAVTCWKLRSRGRSRSIRPSTPSCTSSTRKRARPWRPARRKGRWRACPICIKDLHFLETGEPARLGSSLFKDFVADHDSAYVARCKKAGLVIFGRTSTPEFGLNPNTEPRLNGSCRNPWNLEYSAGGSSGGAAAAVIAGILPVAHATDGGGSIRIPAAQCGLFGLKPSRGRVSFAPDSGEGWGGLSAGHVVSRSVRDSALMLDCTAGIEPGDPYAAPTPERPFVEALGRPPGKLRIALMLKDHRGAKLHPETREGRAGRGQVMREPRPHRRGGGSQARPGGAAAHECQDRGGQHRALLHHALEGAGTRAGCEGCGGGHVGRLPARPEGQRCRVCRGHRGGACGRPQDGARFSPATT